MKKILFLLFNFTLSLSYSQEQSWNTIGNSGTNPANHFIGTTDGQPLAFRINNIEELRISSMGRFITPQSSDNLIFGSRNGFNFNNGKRNTVFGLRNFNNIGTNSSHYNTVLGSDNLNNGGIENTIIGMYNLNEGRMRKSGNIGIGRQLFRSKGTLTGNIAIGEQTLSATNAAEEHRAFYNIAVGRYSLGSFAHGWFNVVIGDSSLSGLASNAEPGESTDLYSYNIGVGYNVGRDLRKGRNNILIGNRVQTSGSVADNELNIGDWIIGRNGTIGIGTFSNLLPTDGVAADGKKYKLYVKDGIKTEKIKVDISSANGWADYVFKKDYPLLSLSEVEKHIQKKGHLPNIPSTDEVMKNGVDLGEMNVKLLEKIEELTLYQIRMSKEIRALQADNKRLNTKLRERNRKACMKK